ncbi:hypothetical protein [Nonomuraea roseola]|uniref:Transposase n=1 Tax=Nonomuraea roseola TaxID=46179 RepID=A0ABV5QB23_9ACTN
MTVRALDGPDEVAVVAGRSRPPSWSLMAWCAVWNQLERACPTLEDAWALAGRPWMI